MDVSSPSAAIGACLFLGRRLWFLGRSGLGSAPVFAVVEAADSILFVEVERLQELRVYDVEERAWRSFLKLPSRFSRKRRANEE